MAPTGRTPTSFAAPSPAWTGDTAYLQTFRKERPVRFIARPWTPQTPVPAQPFSKVVHFVRHGQGYHNLRAEQSGRGCNCVAGAFDECPYILPDLTDSVLTDLGRDQARSVSKVALSPADVELVAVSPLRRALETATLAFAEGPRRPPFIALEDLREHIGVHHCDKRLPIRKQRDEFPHVDFSLIAHDDDVLHSDTIRETRAEMAERMYNALAWVADRPESAIAVVCHSGILATAFNSVVECGTPSLHSHFKTGEMRSVILDISK